MGTAGVTLGGVVKVHGDDDQPIDGPQRLVLLASLLRQHPDAIVSAFDGDGHSMPRPDEIHFQQQAVPARSPLDLLAARSRPGLFEAWERAKSLGASSLAVELVDGSLAVCHMVDVRQSHGVLIGIMVADTPLDLALARADREQVVPRTGRFDKDDQAIIRFADARICQILGYEPTDLIGMRSLGLIHPDDQQRAVEAWRDMVTSPGLTGRLRARHLRGDGSWLWMELTNHNLLGEEERCVVTEMIDISDEMGAFETIRQREQLLTRLAEALPSGVLHVDRQRNVVYSNERFQRLIGSATARTVDDLLAAVVLDDCPTLSDAIDGVLGDGADADVTVRLSGEAERLGRRCAVAIRALTDSEGEPVGAVLCLDDVTESFELRAELERRATVDELTGCLNRAAVLEDVETSLSHNAAGTPGTAVVFLDLDGFKEVNDTFGHLAGDRVLASAACRLRGAMRDHDVIGRLGGDEFLVLLPAIESVEASMGIAARLGAALAEPLESIDDLPARIRSSIGVAWSDSPSIGADALVAAADRAMYESKALHVCAPVLAVL